MKAMIIAAILGSLPTSHSVTTHVCGAYEGSYEQSNLQKTWQEPISAYCAVNNGDARCTVATTNERWLFIGSVVKDEPTRFIVEGYDDSGRTFQLLCENRSRCVGFRVFNQAKQVGLQCVRGN